MKRSIFAVGMSLALCVATISAATADEKFEAIAKAYIDGFLQAHPERATALGDHRFDDRLTDYSTSARQKELAQAKKCAAALKQFGDGSKLTDANRVDLRILAANADRDIFELEQLKEPDSNPMVYTTSFADSVYFLVARTSDKPETQVANLRKRLEAIPRVIDQAKQNLQHPSRLRTAAAADQVRDSVALIRLGLGPLLDQVPNQKQDLAALQATTATALERYMKWLGTDLLPRSDGDFRLGAEKFRKKLRFATGSDLSMEEILKRAKEDVPKTQALMYETAVPLYKTYFPNAKEETDNKKLIKAVLGKMAEKQSSPLTMLDDLRKVTAETTDFAKLHNLATVPEGPLDITVMPEFRRETGLLFYCEAPGPLEQGGKTFFAIAQPPPRWPRPRQESFYREYNSSMMRDLAAREAIPGCYFQMDRANKFKAPTMVRAVFPNHAFTEGWACSAEQMMTEAGYGGPEVRLQQLKMRLRADFDAIIDQGVHAGNMGATEALKLMKLEGFQEEGQTVANWRRSNLTSAELSLPFVGMIEHLDMLEAAKTKAGSSFDQKNYNDQVTSFGSIPVKDVRKLVGL